MKYLDCIELLNLGLKTLKEGERVQIPISKMMELQMIVVRVNKKVENSDNTAFIRVGLNDLTMSISIAQENKAVRYLTDQMRQALAEGLRSVRTNLCKLAYRYYSDFDFEPTDQVIPLMREVVQYGS